MLMDWSPAYGDCQKQVLFVLAAKRHGFIDVTN
jgi:hypothetical protein